MTPQRANLVRGSSVVIDMASYFVQLSDTHVVVEGTDEVLYVDNNARLAAAVSSINAEPTPISAVIATGDLTQWGSDAEYDHLTELLSELTVPVLPIPGNHDDRAAMRRSFPHHPWADPEHLSWVVAVDGVRIIGLDSTVPGEAGAAFDDDRERWLSGVLAGGHDGPTLLAMHHPPFASGIEWMDADGFAGLDRLIALIESSGAVDRIMCGHMHRQMSATVGGVVAEVGPATAVHVALDLAPGAPTRLIREAPGYRIFRVDGRNIVGHVRSFATGETPFEPAWA